MQVGIKLNSHFIWLDGYTNSGEDTLVTAPLSRYIVIKPLFAIGARTMHIADDRHFHDNSLCAAMMHFHLHVLASSSYSYTEMATSKKLPSHANCNRTTPNSMRRHLVAGAAWLVWISFVMGIQLWPLCPTESTGGNNKRGPFIRQCALWRSIVRRCLFCSTAYTIE